MGRTNTTSLWEPDIQTKVASATALVLLKQILVFPSVNSSGFAMPNQTHSTFNKEPIREFVMKTWTEKHKTELAKTCFRIAFEKGYSVSQIATCDIVGMWSKNSIFDEAQKIVFADQPELIKYVRQQRDVPWIVSALRQVCYEHISADGPEVKMSLEPIEKPKKKSGHNKWTEEQKSKIGQLVVNALLENGVTSDVFLKPGYHFKGLFSSILPPIQQVVFKDSPSLIRKLRQFEQVPWLKNSLHNAVEHRHREFEKQSKIAVVEIEKSYAAPKTQKSVQDDTVSEPVPEPAPVQEPKQNSEALDGIEISIKIGAASVSNFVDAFMKLMTPAISSTLEAIVPTLISEIVKQSTAHTPVQISIQTNEHARHIPVHKPPVVKKPRVLVYGAMSVQQQAIESAWGAKFQFDFLDKANAARIKALNACDYAVSMTGKISHSADRALKDAFGKKYHPTSGCVEGIKRELQRISTSLGFENAKQ